MNRFFVLTGALVLGVIVTAVVQGADDAATSIKSIMKTSHGEAGLRPKLVVEIKEEKWDEAAKNSKEYLRLAEALAKETPKKGTAASWKKLAGGYEKAVKALDTAVVKKDATAANAALKKIGGTCGGCHKAHKGK